MKFFLAVLTTYFILLTIIIIQWSIKYKVSMIEKELSKVQNILNQRKGSNE